jgi:fatty acid desaturase
MGGRDAAVAAVAGTNLRIAGALAVVHLFAYAVVPLVLMPLDPAWAVGAFAVTLATPSLWALVHEGIHRHLHPTPKTNDRVARGLAILFGSPLRLVRFGHLTHHQLNGHAVERPDHRAGRVLYYAYLTVGLYLAELAGCLVGFLPRPLHARLARASFYDGHPEAPGAADAAVRALTSDRARHELRLDGALALLVIALAAVAYGPDWAWLAAALLGRALLVSLLDNAFHYEGPLGDPHSGHNLAMPDWLARIWLNFNLHRVHHRHPGLPWSELPRAMREDGDRCDRSLATAVLRQFRGPIAGPGAARPEPERA